jgi:plasmid replication initiation protein
MDEKDGHSECPIVPKNEETFVTQSNKLIEAVLNQPFKAFELRVLCFLSSYVNRNRYVKEYQNLEEKEALYMKIEIPRKDFCLGLNIDPKHLNRQMDRFIFDLMQQAKTVYIKQGDRRIMVVLFPRIIYDKKNIIFHLSDDLSSHLQNLKRDFTRYSLKTVMAMRSSYSIRAYQILKRYQNLKSKVFSIDQFREMLGIQNSYNRRLDNFKREVLDVIQQDLSTTDLKIDFSVDKSGKEAKSITFRMTNYNNQSQQAYDLFKKDINFILSHKASFSPIEHAKIKDQWQNSNELDANVKIFKIWCESTLTSYEPFSKERIQLIPQEDELIYPPFPNWYVRFLKSNVKVG